MKHFWPHILAILIFSACHALDNRHDTLAVQCDINDKTSGQYILKFVSPSGLDLTAEQVAQLRVQYQISDESTPTTASPKACVLVPEAASVVKASIAGETPLSTEVRLSPDQGKGTIRTVELEAPGYLELGLKCPKNGLLASTTLDDVIELKKSLGKLSGYQVNLAVLTLSGEPVVNLYQKSSETKDLNLPAQLSLNDLPEGNYKLDLSVQDNFHADNKEALRSQCGLTVRRSCTNDESFDPKTISCVPKLCDNSYRIGAVWTEDLRLERGTGKYECRLADGAAQKKLLSASCKAGFIKLENECLGAKKIEKTCALLENDSVACWGTMTRTSRIPYNPQVYRDVNTHTAFRFKGKLTHFNSNCAGVESDGLKCWSYPLFDSMDPSYLPLDEKKYPKFNDVFPEDTIAFHDDCGITNSGTYFCASLGTSKVYQLPEKIIDFDPRWVVDDKGNLYAIKNGAPANLTLDETTSYDDFYRVKGLPDKVKSIRGGLFSSCILTAGGSVMCAGDNSLGNIGANLNESVVPKFTKVVDSSGSPLEGMSQLTKIEYNSTIYCALKNNGQVFCWGANYQGELASGTAGDDQEGFANFSRFAVPIRVEVSKVFSL